MFIELLNPYKNKYLMSLNIYDYINTSLGKKKINIKKEQTSIEDAIIIYCDDLSEWDLICYHNNYSTNNIKQLPILSSKELIYYSKGNHSDEFYEETFDAGFLIFKLIS